MRSHHEHYDGSGYPDGLAGKEIPFGASIVGVCDAFGAMTKRRSYSDAIGVADALEALRRGSGSQFDPLVVRGMCELMEGSEVALPAGLSEPGQQGD